MRKQEAKNADTDKSRLLITHDLGNNNNRLVFNYDRRPVRPSLSTRNHSTHSPRHQTHEAFFVPLADQGI